MRSVADNRPGVADELGEISPELVLVDPELARLLRESPVAVAEAPRAPTLRLVRDADAVRDEPLVAPTRGVEPALEPEQLFDPMAQVSTGETEVATDDEGGEELVVPRALEDETWRTVGESRLDEPITPEPRLQPSGAERAAEPGVVIASAPVGAPSARTQRPLVQPARASWGVLRWLLSLVLGAGVLFAVVLLVLEAAPWRGSEPTAAPVTAGGTPSVDAIPTAPESSDDRPVERPPAKQQPAKQRQRHAAQPTPPSTAPRTSGPRRFAWAPVKGAVGYHVELYRGGDRVLARETRQPTFSLGESWTYESRTVRLTPGNYRWYVWPVLDSGRTTRAVVQAKLTVP